MKRFTYYLVFLFATIQLSSNAQNTYTVTKAIDVLPSDTEYVGTLRWAVEEADADTVFSTIVFNIQGVDIPCIIPISNGPLEINGHGLLIDGNTQPAPYYTGIEPKIELYGINSPEECFYFNIGENDRQVKYDEDTEIRNLTINNFNTGVGINISRIIEVSDCVFINNSIGIFLTTASAVSIHNNYVGITRNFEPGSEQYSGIYIADNSTCCARYNEIVSNVISYNSRYGILVTGPYAMNNVISKNVITNNIPGAIDLYNGPNYNILPPVVTGISGNVVSGTTERANDKIEVFGSLGEQNANKYLGFCLSDANSNWSFTIPPNESWDYIVATATFGSDIYQNTSELSNAHPYMSFEPINSQYCETNSPVALSATPPGGVFSGPGVQGNYFYPSIVDPSSPEQVTITYRYYINETEYLEATQATTVNPSEFEFVSIPASCNPGGDGSIAMEVLEGSGTYTYSWSTQNGNIPIGQEDDQTISPVPIGNYNVLFTDAGYGCLPQYRSVTLNNPAVTVEVDNLLVCDNTTTQVQAYCTRNYTPVSPPPPYTYRYQWYRILPDHTLEPLHDVIDEEESQYGLSAGNYKLVVTDQVFNCSDEVSFTVISLNMSVSVGNIKHVTCYGGNNAEATALVTGGILPYVYEWYKSEYSGDVLIHTGSSTARNLTSGMYFVTVTNDNGNGCMVRSDLFPIDEPGELIVLQPISVTDCRAIVSIEGGTPEYTYSWYKLEGQNWNLKGEEVTQDREITIDNLGVGEYYVSVNDQNNCGPVTASFRVGEINMVKTYDLCFRFRGDFEVPATDPPLTQIPVNPTVSDIVRTIGNRKAQCFAQANAEMAKGFGDRCSKPDNINDELTVTYTQNPYHYTLYYYDRAGNLVRTVPPEGVDSDVETRDEMPLHTMVTEYDYNSINQVIRQKSPDGGESRFIYDPKGRLRFSQNAKQAALTGGLVFSYTKYDELGRVIEVGECKHNGAITNFGDLEAESGNAAFPQEESLTDDNSQQIWTIYSQPGLYYYYGKPQRFLDNRISYTKTADDVYTYYSYDPHGNVEWLIQVLPGFTASHIGYEYDLISNKVTMVKYNEGKVEDRFFHKYGYDADNRLIKVETSRDGYLWETDGEYTYYAHGPLKSLGIGEDKLQKVDYSYTINGWLKGINKPSLVGTAETDGYSPDIYGTSLQYFARDVNDPNDHGDYVTSASSYNFEQDHAYNDNKRLYNGNIVSWSGKYDLTSLPQFYPFEFGSNETGYEYKYDKLNRIKASNFNVLQSSLWQAKEDYQSTFAYDGNGNITHLSRNADANQGVYAMDDLTYTYQDPNSNRLASVAESLTNNGINGTLSDISGIHSYTYDEIGNLTSDAEVGNPDNIETIEWNAYGKISKINHIAGSSLPDIEYIYDGLGNRVIKKKVYSNPVSIVREYYVRDAQGNIMTIYSNVYDPTATERVFVVEEQPIYGSSRLGTLSTGAHVILGGASNEETLPSGTYIRTLGQKNYELTDHLGNIRAVIKDYVGTDDLHAQVKSLVDYYAFGMEMPKRKYNEIYRFGFNGKETDSEWSGQHGAIYDYGFRIYDARISRFLSVDPLFKSFPWWTPYQFAGNTPIQALDLDGLEILSYMSNFVFKPTQCVLGDGRKIASYTLSHRTGESTNREFISNSRYHGSVTPNPEITRGGGNQVMVLKDEDYTLPKRFNTGYDRIVSAMDYRELKGNGLSDAALAASESLYNSSKIFSNLKDVDLGNQFGASAIAFNTIMGNSSMVESAFLNIKWSDDFAADMKAGKINFSIENFKSDVMNYIVDGGGDFANFNFTGYADDFRKYCQSVFRTGESLIAKNNLNMQVPKHGTFWNSIYKGSWMEGWEKLFNSGGSFSTKK